MRAYELQQFGLDGLRMVERPELVVGPGQASVRVTAVSLNYRDWLMVQGEYNPRQPLPLVPLSDGVGVVTAVGEGVTRVKVGDRVAAAFSQSWIAGEPRIERLRGTLGGPLDGMLRESIVLHEDGLVRVPGHLSDEEGASLPCAALTAWNALIEQGHLKAGETVVVQGTGGVSIFGLQFAKMCGARVIVTSSSNEKLERAKALGADEVINYREAPNWDRRVKQLTGGVGADHIIEVGGADTLVKSLKAVRVGGTISVIGVLGGKSLEVPLTLILMQNVRLQGVLVGNRDMFDKMNQAIEHHRLRPLVDRVFGFAEVHAAFEHLAAGRHFGKIAVRIAE